MQPSPLAADSLAHRLYWATPLVAQIQQGVALDVVLADPRCQSLTPATRATLQDFCYGVARWRGSASFLLQQLCARPPQEPIASLLLLALTLLLQRKYEPHTLVDQAVQAAAHWQPGAKGLVNGVLREYGRSQADLLAAMQADLAAVFNFPPWWLRKVQKTYPTQWKSLLKSAQDHPPLTLRVNTQRQPVAAYLAKLNQAGIEAQQVGPQAIVLSQALPVSQIPGFSDGLVSVQDAGAQLAAPLLAVQPGQRVLDACAAPGGKSGHILELVDCALTALDIDASRLRRVEENLQRLQLTSAMPPRVVLGDAGQAATWWDGVPFDRILADVPCSASGIVRRQPDIRWRRRAGDLRQLQAQQLALLQALWPLLAAGGKLLYATCSLFPDEGETVIAHFLQAEPTAARDALQVPTAQGAALVPAATSGTGGLQVLPNQPLAWPGYGEVTTHDGFFYALLHKAV
ncbi:16S rRNA (cytosine(967)-C(5))-methyltransferase RsmB [Parvibium lacunae]